MPGPAKHKKNFSTAKAHANGSSRSSNLISCVQGIDDDTSWMEAANVICKMLEIPDLETRSGLKKVHRDFTNIYNRLNSALTQNADDDRVAGSIVSIYTRMCSDSILRDKLVRDKDLLSILLPLLDRDACRVLVLRALCAITHHGGREIRLAIAKRTSSLVRILEEFPDDALCAELVIVIVGHSASAAVSSINEDPPDKALLKAVDVPRLLPLLLFQLKLPGVSSTLVDHALEFFVYATQHCSKEFLALPSSVNFLVACTRSADIQTRSVSVSSLLRLYGNEAEKEDITRDSIKMTQNMKRGVPQHLSDAIMQTCGPYESEMYRTVYASSNFVTAMTEYAKNRDMFKLALEVVRLVLWTEHSVTRMCWQRTGESEVSDLGLPFTWWDDALPLCANELRTKGMMDMADIIDLKYLLLKSRSDEAQSMAERAIQRNPRIGFFYYIQTFGTNLEEGLRAAKKGSNCPDLTNYVKHALLFRGIDIAFSMGIKRLEEANTGGQLWNEGIAFLMCALEDANEFINSACPDNRAMKTVLCLQPLLTLIIKGHEIGPELRDLRGNSEKLRMAEEYATLLGYNVKNTDIRMTRHSVLSQMSTASQEWDEAISHFEYEGGRKELTGVVPEKLEDNLAAWLENVNLEEGATQNGALTLERVHMTHPAVNASDFELYRCSWCRNPSAALRKCIGCKTTRYCDANCQKEHWSTHRKECKRMGKST